MTSQFENLLSPLQIGPLKIRNRVLVSAHVPGFAEDNKPGDQYIRYHQQYAENGVGMQFTGGTPVHHSGMLGTTPDGLWNLDDSIIPGYQRLSARIHEHGGRILAQLAHSAGTVLINQPGRESWSASAVRSQITGSIAHEMTVDEIKEVIDAFSAGAARVAKGEMDGVEVLAAFGYLPQAFLSPLSNWREDDYGGSLENRMRFLMELLTAVKAELNGNQILGLRIPGDEFEPGGLTLSDIKQVCQNIEKTGLVDYFNIIAHTNFTHTGRSKHWAPTPSEHGTFVALAAEIKKVVSLPVFTVGRIVNPAHAEHIIASGKADMVGMTRAHICDPAIVSKIKRNRVSEIRPCVGANTCIANRYAGKTIRCMHNPAVATPGKIIQPSSNRKKVVVVGAGPAGLEAARLAAEKGHHVRVYEALQQAGGQLRIWASGASTGELQRIIDWRLSELERHNVELFYGQAIRPSDLQRFDADDVIIATGSTPQPSSFASDRELSIMTPHELLGHNNLQYKSALVVSDGRGQAGVVAAEKLAHLNCKVELVSSDFAVAADLDPTNRNAWYERLGKLGVVLTDRKLVVNIDKHVVTLKDVFSGRTETRNHVELLVDWQGCQVNDELVTTAPSSDQKWKLHKIGDCSSPRNVEVAMAEAAAVAEAI